MKAISYIGVSLNNMTKRAENTPGARYPTSIYDSKINVILI